MSFNTPTECSDSCSVALVVVVAVVVVVVVVVFCLVFEKDTIPIIIAMITIPTIIKIISTNPR